MRQPRPPEMLAKPLRMEKTVRFEADSDFRRNLALMEGGGGGNL